MTRSIRSTALVLIIAALSLAAATGAGAASVAPPGATDGYAAAAVRTAGSPGCRSTNVIEFRDRTVIPLVRRYAVRHTGRIRCNVRTRIRCHATLFQRQRRISEIGGKGRRRCRMASSFGASDSYPPGTGFRERYRYKLTLVRKRQRWSGTSGFCPKLSDNRRTLVCRDAHGTTAPRRHVDTHG